MRHKWGWSGVVAAMVGVSLFSDAAFGQEGGRRGGGLFGRMGVVALAGAESVQNELGLDAAVKEKIAAIVDEYRNESREQFQSLGGGFQNASAEERQQMMAKMQEASQKLNAKFAPKLKEVLKPEQFTRLKQINWQASGAAALSDSEIVETLQITKEQQEKIAALIKDYQQKQQGLFGGGNPQDAFAKMRELTQERDQKAAEILTQEQQDKFKELKGKAFDLASLRPARPGGAGQQN